MHLTCQGMESSWDSAGFVLFGAFCSLCGLSLVGYRAPSRTPMWTNSLCKSLQVFGSDVGTYGAARPSTQKHPTEGTIMKVVLAGRTCMNPLLILEARSTTSPEQTRGLFRPGHIALLLQMLLQQMTHDAARTPFVASWLRRASFALPLGSGIRLSPAASKV